MCLVRSARDILRTCQLQDQLPISRMEHIDNIVYPGTAGATTCGYCSPPGERSAEATSYHAATLQALKLSCSVGRIRQVSSLL